MCCGGGARRGGTWGRGEGGCPPPHQPNWAQHIGRATATRDTDRRSGLGAAGGAGTPPRGRAGLGRAPPHPPLRAAAPPSPGPCCPNWGGGLGGGGHVGCFKTHPAQPQRGHAWALRGAAAGWKRCTGAATLRPWGGGVVAAELQPRRAAVAAICAAAVLHNGCIAHTLQQRGAAVARPPFNPPPSAPCPHPKAHGGTWGGHTRGCGRCQGGDASLTPPPRCRHWHFPLFLLHNPVPGGGGGTHKDPHAGAAAGGG